MKKIFIFCTFLFFSSSLFASYTIKIAVYRDHDNLMRFIAKVPKAAYRKNIIIEKKNHLNYVTSISYEYEKEVQKALKAYKKVFPDAFIEEIEDKNSTLKSKKHLVQDNIEEKTITPEPTMSKMKVNKIVVEETVSEIKEPVVTLPTPTLDAKALLLNKTVYLCKEDPSQRNSKGMVQLDFKEGVVLYRKLSKIASPIEIPYLFDKDSVILTLSDVEFKYQILKEEDTFLQVHYFINTKQGQNFRFYFDENLALDCAAE